MADQRRASAADDEGRLIAALLGREPRYAWQVATRCPDGTPQVLLTAPVQWEEGRCHPFPTYLWLVCPRLKQEVARLESEGWVGRLEALLAGDRTLREEFLAGQRWIVGERWRHGPDGESRERLPAKVRALLEAVGIAGSRNPAAVKCLHAHLAQELAVGHNPLGRLLLRQTGPCTAEPPCRAWMPVAAPGAAREEVEA